MGMHLLVHFSAHKSAHPSLQGDRSIHESAETEDRNQKVRQSSYDPTSPLIEPLLSGSISILCVLIVLSGYAFWYGRRIHDSLGAGPRPPTVRLDRAIVVGKTKGQAETFQGIPYARPP
jgi:hypothetical protein